MFGVTTVETLKKNRPYVIIGAFALGMILTPPDVISQTLIAIPMWLLFEAGLIFAPLIKSRSRTTKDSADDNQSVDDSETSNNDNEEEASDADLEEEMDKIDDEFAKMDDEFADYIKKLDEEDKK